MAEKKINGRTFKVEPMLALSALVLQARLLKIAGPAMARLGDIFKGGGDDEARNAGALAAIADIFVNAEPEALAALIKDVVELAYVLRPSGTYGRCDLDGDFTMNKGDILPVMFFVLQTQFGDFFTALPGLGSLATKAPN